MSSYRVVSIDGDQDQTMAAPHDESERYPPFKNTTQHVLLTAT